MERIVFPASLDDAEVAARTSLLQRVYGRSGWSVVFAQSEGERAIVVSAPATSSPRRGARALASLRELAAREDAYALSQPAQAEDPPAQTAAPAAPSSYAIVDCAGNVHTLTEPDAQSEWSDAFTEAVLGALWDPGREHILAPGQTITIRRLS